MLEHALPVAKTAAGPTPRSAERDQDERFMAAAIALAQKPCGMCSMTSIWSQMGRIVYSAGRDQVHAMYSEDRDLDTMDFIRDASRDDIAMQGGVLSDDAVQLYYRPGDDVPTEEQGNR